jgi:hypothetical protein
MGVSKTQGKVYKQKIIHVETIIGHLATLEVSVIDQTTYSVSGLIMT